MSKQYAVAKGAGWRAHIFAAALLLSGCSQLLHDEAALAPAEIVAGCCDAVGPFPDWMVQLADANADTLRRLGLIQLRPGHMTGQPEAQALLEAALIPLDVVFFHSGNRVSGHLIPGRFTHGAVYIGTEDQLRAAGLWNLPAVRPWHDEIAAGAVYLEAVDGGVHLAHPQAVLDTDAVVALRPRKIDRAAALTRGMEKMCVPFDMRFDATDPSALFCAELIALMFPAANLPHVPAPGRETILIDGIIAGALSDDVPFGLIGYIEATAGGEVRVLSARELAWDVRREWPEIAQVN